MIERDGTQCIFPEIVTRLLKIIHRSCCKKFNVRAVFFLPKNTRQPYHYTGGSVHLLTDKRLRFMTAWGANINAVLLGSDIMLASWLAENLGTPTKAI